MACFDLFPELSLNKRNINLHCISKYQNNTWKIQGGGSSEFEANFNKPKRDLQAVFSVLAGDMQELLLQDQSELQ